MLDSIKIGCKTWTLSKKELIPLNFGVTGQCWTDRVMDVLKSIGEKELQFYTKMAQQTLAYAGHVLRRSSDI